MPVFTSSIEVTADYPTIKPSLNLNFARARALDPRITFTRSHTNIVAATYIGRDGQVKRADVNEPRFDHDYDTGESLGLLMEEQRTNFCGDAIPSNDWGSLNNSTITSTTELAPDGTNTAYRYQGSASSPSSLFRVGIPAFTPNGTDEYTISFWVKQVVANSQAGQNLICDLHDGGPTINYSSLLVQDKWVRVVQQGIPPNSPKTFFDLISNTLNDGTYDFWGLQIEKGSFATSLILTTDSTIGTRGAEEAKVDEQIASGDITICAEYKLRLTSSNQWNRLFGFGEGSSDLRPLVDGSGQINFFNYSTEFTVPWPASQPDFDTPFKIAMAVRQGVANSVVIDGGSVNTQTNTNPGAYVNWNELYLGWSDTGNNPKHTTGHIKYFRVYNDSMTDTQLQLLSS